MKTLTIPCRNKTYYYLLLSLALLWLMPQISSAQTITFNLVTAPCNFDGVLEYTVSGVTPPMTVNIWTPMGSTTTTLTGTTGTITAYAGNTVYVSANNGSTGAYGWYSGAPPFTYSVSTTTATCPALGTASATVTGGVPPYTYEWYDLSYTTLLGTGSPVSLPEGQYTLMITDGNGCKYGSSAGGDSIYIYTDSGLMLSTGSTSAACTNGTATVGSVTGGLAPYTYLWSNGATTSAITGLTEGYYVVTVTDANGCSEYAYEYVSQAYYVNVNVVTNPATCLFSDGSAMVLASSGVPPYTYSCSSGATTASMTGLPAGTYLETVTDANGCHGQSYFTINSTSPVIANYTSTASSCISPSGTATLTITGGTPPYNTTWYVTPIQTGTTLTGQAPGTYSFQIVDANGCIRTGNVVIPPLVPLIGSLTTSNTPCGSMTGTAVMNITSGTPPYFYSWNTGGTTSSLGGLGDGYYTCTVTDGDGCQLTKYGYVSELSPITLGFFTTQASCIFTSDGSINTVVSGGTPPYTYNWSTGAVTSSITGLATGYYSLYVTDASGCTKSASTFVPYNASTSSCYCKLEGIAYNDANSNCIMDAGEAGIPGIPVNCSGIGTGYTNYTGYYSFIVPGGSYNLSEIVQPEYPLSSCQPAVIPVTATASTGCVITNNFANNILPIHDLHITNTYLVPPIPGNTFTEFAVVSNDGTLTENTIQLGWKHDGILNYTSANVPYTQLDPSGEPNWYSVTSGFPTILPNNSFSVHNQLFVPTSTPLGTLVHLRDTVCHQAPITDWILDYTPWNNIDDQWPTVVGSYDPNMKEVHPKGVGPQGFIPMDEKELEYIIHFQNTGTYYAQNIVVRDTLDPSLNWSTLKPGWSDHSYTTFVDENGVATFTFSNIHLPWEDYDYEGSMGVFSYTIELNTGLAEGTQIKNTAGIYFDYNAPIITNTTINTLDSHVGVTEKPVVETGFTLYPNPANTSVTLALDTKTEGSISAVEVYDMTGKNILLHKENGNSTRTLNLNIAEWERGMYMVKINTGSSTAMKKLIKN